MKTPRLFALLFASLMLVASPARQALAAGVNAKHVASDAKWYVHLDADAARQSTLYTAVLDSLRAQFPIDDAVAQIKQVIGVDLLKDISGVTIYNTSFEKDVAAVLVYAKVDKTLLTQAIASNPNHKDETYGKHLIHIWTDDNDGKTKTAAFWGDEVVVMGDKSATLKAALDVLDDQKKGGSELIKEQKKGTFAYAAAHLSQSPDQNVSQLLSNTEAVQASAGESDGNLLVNLNLTAKTADQASQLMKILEGVKAFADFGMKDTPVTQGLIRKVKVAADGAKISLSFSNEAKSLLEVLQKVDQEHKAKAAKEAAKP